MTKAKNTILITGANRGLGLAMTSLRSCVAPVTGWRHCRRNIHVP